MEYSNGMLTDFTRILDNRVKNISAKVGQATTSEYLKYMFKRTNAERITTDIGITGLGMANFISDAEISPSDAPIQGFEKNYTQQHLTHKVKISFQTMHFLIKLKDKAKLDSEVESKVLDLQRALESAKEYYAQNFLAQGFNASWNFSPISGVSATVTSVDATTADGVEWWSQAHLREDGGTNWTNVIVDGSTASPVFAMSSLEAAHQLQAIKKDGRGLPLGSTLGTLICVSGSATEQVAKRIKGTIDYGIYPGTFNDAPSVPSFEILAIKNYGANGVGPLSWGMFDKGMMTKDYGPQYIESLPNTVAPVMTDIENKDTVMQADTIFTMGASDMRPFMWSKGDGVTV
jgi:hypothetical protein